MKKIVSNGYYASILAIVLFMTSFLACRKEHMTLTTTSDVNITGYLERYPETFSMFLEMLDRSKTSGYLGAYGQYTLFAPTNDAVKTWLTTTGKSSLSELSDTEITSIVKFHLIKDTLSTASFTDGKLRTKTYYGQYLLTGVNNINGTSLYTVNRQANITKINIRLGNGIMHVLDHVLVPATKTVAQLVEENGKYSIFTEALKATKFYDSLNIVNNVDTTRLFQTVLLQSDSTFKAAGINSYSELVAKLSPNNTPTSHSDSLWLFVAYHITPGANFLADFATTSSFNTLAPLEVINASLHQDSLLLNDLDFNEKHEVGAMLNRSAGDIAASNGVLQDVADYFKIKVRSPVPVYFDVAEQKELKDMGAIWRVPGAFVNLGVNNATSIVPGINFGNDKSSQQSTYSVFASNDATNYTCGNDCIKFPMGTGGARHPWIEFKTPLIVKGTYKVWVCQRYMSSKYPYIQATVDAGTADEQVMPNILNVNLSLSGYGVSLAATNSNDLLYAAGAKRYSLEAPASRSEFYGRYMGTVKITTTNRHTIRLTRVGGNGEASPNFWLDMIHFIPVDMDQYHMRFDRSGKTHIVQ